MLCVSWNISGWTVRQVTDRMTDEDNELLIGTSEALWIISIGAYEVEHDILEERVLEQLSYHIPLYEMGKYNDITPEERGASGKGYRIYPIKGGTVETEEL